MKFIKLGIISIIVLFLILTTLGLLLPSTVRVTRNINIHAPFDTLHNYVGNVKNWPLWMEGIDKNTMKFTSLPDSKNHEVATINKLQIYLTKNIKDTIESIWQTSGKSKQRCVFELSDDTTNNTINLNWYFEQKPNWYPWERLPTLANDKILGPFMEHSLDKLKEITERNAN